MTAATLLVVGVGWAGLLDQGTESSRHVAYCRTAADDAEASGGLGRAAGVWKACAAEAERRQFSDVVPMLKAQADLASVAAEVEPSRSTDVQTWATTILSHAAAYPTLELPTDLVPRTWRAWMESDRGRAYAADVRTVTVLWTTSAPRANELLRASLEDVGLTWADPGSPEIDVVVNAEARLEAAAGESSKQGTLRASTAKLAVQSVRFRRSERTVDGFAAVATAESPEQSEADDRALRDACAAGSRAVLGRVLAELLAE